MIGDNDPNQDNPINVPDSFKTKGIIQLDSFNQQYNPQAMKQMSQSALYRKQQLATQSLNSTGVLGGNGGGGQQQTGPGTASGIASGVSQGVGLLVDDFNMKQAAKSIQTVAPTAQTDAYGRPLYNLGSFAGQTGAIRAKGASTGEALGGAARGAAAGASIAGPWGAVVGGVVGLAGSLIGGAARKRAQNKRKRLAQSSLLAANNVYNSGVVQANNEDMAQADYNYYNNPNTRTNNIYNANTPT